MTKIAAYDDTGIWGVGDNEEQAKAEAEGFIKESMPEDEQQAEIDGLKTAPISDDMLALLVDEDGNPSPCSIDDAPFIVDPDGTLIPDPENAGEEVEDDDGDDGEEEEEATSAPDAEPETKAASVAHEEEDHIF